jgi:two-component system cell cycle sensor histidine kinase/response regulator CckA
MKILIVDDDADSRVLLSILLKKNGFTIAEACDGKQGLKMVKEFSPGLVITDIMMPEMDGYMLCQKIKEDPKLAHIPVIFYSATYTSLEDQHLGKELGASRYIIKPADPGKFLKTLLEFIKEHEIHQLPVPNELLKSGEEVSKLYQEVLSEKLHKKAADLKKEHEELLMSQGQFRNMVESLKKDFIFFSLNGQGKLKYISPSVFDILGYSQEEFFSCNEEIWVTNPTNPETHQQLLETLRGNEKPHFEISVPTIKNDLRIFSVKQVPLFDENGDVVSVEGIAQDITEKRKDEIRLLKLHKGIQQSPATVIITDIDGAIEFANPKFEAITGYSLSEILGKNIRFLKSEEHSSDFYRELWDTISSGSAWRGELRSKKKNGELFWKRSIIAPVFYKDKIINYIDIGEEITKEKENEIIIQNAQKQLVAIQKMANVGALAAGVSHEILNPVNIISVHTQMLQRKTKDDSNIQNFCNKVEHEIDRIQKITNSLLAFSRSGNSEFENGFIKNAIESTLAIVEEDYKLDNINIVRDWCCKPVLVRHDPDQIRQVFLNLLHNAKQAMPDGGTITIGCKIVQKAGKKFNQFIFSDTGTGMSKEVRLKIFEPFFTTKPEGEGTGMGLSVIHEIIEGHCGKIIVESEEGKGTTFFINFPLS